MKKCVLVTGGAGYIGSHVCLALFKNGFIPVVYDNLSRGHAWAVKWGPFEKGDILNKKSLLKLFKQYKPIAVMHLAALAYVGESVQDPARYYETNVAGTLNLLGAIRDTGKIPVVFSSSCATYGIPKNTNIEEDNKQEPINPYGHSKYMIEQIFRDYDIAYGLKAVILRYFNAAGADPNCEIGEAHNPETHLIPLILKVVGGEKDCINIFGDDYSTPDGTCIRDYIHVSDIADAHVKALVYLLNGNESEFFNLGIGIGYSVKEIIHVVEKLTQKKIMVNITKRRIGDPPVLITKVGKAKDILGWEPKYKNIDLQIEHALEWYEKLQREGN